jgi:RNA polymerase sigma factor (sigma-70 family)
LASALSLLWNTIAVTPDGSSPTHANLLEQQAFLRRLARSLVTDAHRAEDLAQDATLAALEHAPANATSLRAWLARVVRNRAINLGQAEERRQAREQGAMHPAPLRSPDELEAQFQVQRRVMAAVDRLDEPYRTAILLRYYRDLTPTAIAEQLGVPLATVKSRLARALARLREQLDDTQPEGGRAWVAVLAGGLGEFHRPAIATMLAAGGIAVTMKLAFGLAAIGLATIGGWWLLRPVSKANEPPVAPTSSSFAREASTDATAQVQLHEPELVTRRAAEVPEDSTQAAAKVGPPPAWSLNLDLRGWDAADVSPAKIEIRHGIDSQLALSAPRSLAAQIPFDLTPLFEAGKSRPDRLTVNLDHPSFLPVEIGVLVPTELQQPAATEGHLTATVELTRPKAIVTGTVTVPAGSSLERVRAAIYGIVKSRPASEPIEVVQPDESGRFRLRADSTQEHAVVAFVHHELNQEDAPSLRPETRRLVLEPGQELELEPLDLGEGESLSGRVTLVGGAAVPAGRLAAKFKSTSIGYVEDLYWQDGRFEHSRVDGAWKSDGIFRLTGLSPHLCRLVATPFGSTPSSPPVIRVGDTKASELELLPSASDITLVLDVVQLVIGVFGQGEPIAGAKVQAKWKTGPTGWSSTWGKTDSMGRVVVEVDPESGLDLEILDARWPRKQVSFTPAELTPFRVIEIQLDGEPREPAVLAIHFQGDRALLANSIIDLDLYDVDKYTKEELNQWLSSGSVVSGSVGRLHSGVLGFAWLKPDGGKLEWTESDGAWVAADVPPSSYVVRLRPRPRERGGACFLRARDFEVDLSSGERVELDWMPDIGGTARINLTALQTLKSAGLLDAEGSEVNTYYNSDGPEPGGFHGSSVMQGPGLFELSAVLAPGTYALRLKLTDGTTRELPVRIEAGRVNDVTIEPDDL